MAAVTYDEGVRESVLRPGSSTGGVMDTADLDTLATAACDEAHHDWVVDSTPVECARSCEITKRL